MLMVEVFDTTNIELISLKSKSVVNKVEGEVKVEDKVEVEVEVEAEVEDKVEAENILC